jgi:hypothetical protein
MNAFILFTMLYQASKRRPNNSQNKIICMETSAKTKQGVQEVFIKAVEIFIRKPVSVGAPSYRAGGAAYRGGA